MNNTAIFILLGIAVRFSISANLKEKKTIQSASFAIQNLPEGCVLIFLFISFLNDSFNIYLF